MDLLYHRGEYGVAWTAHAAGAKKFDVFVCLSIELFEW